MVFGTSVEKLTAGELQLRILVTREGEERRGLCWWDEGANAERRLPFTGQGRHRGCVWRKVTETEQRWKLGNQGRRRKGLGQNGHGGDTGN